MSARTHNGFTATLLAALLCFLVVLCPGKTIAEEKPDRSVPNRYGIGLTAGNTYKPENNISFVQITGLALWDYRKIWRHKAPDSLRFKVEYSLGSTTRPDKKLITSLNMFALYYLDGLSVAILRPYIEGGIGAIYTDFQVKGQGLRFNFNPQMGLGTEFTVGSGTTLFSSLRLHHISNGGLDHDNRGINSVILTAGYIF